MTAIEKNPLDLRLPANHIQVASLQPHLQLTGAAPFQWQAGAIDFQVEAIGRTLTLAQNGLDGNTAHFTLFPEYSVPGLIGAQAIHARVSSPGWANETVVIAGLHGLSNVDYHHLCQQLPITTSDANSPDRVPEHQWVNCCLIWAKDRQGQVQVFAQSKIRPAWLEHHMSSQNMFLGNTIHIFECRFTNGTPCRFAVFICYDWVTIDNGTTVPQEVLNQLNQDWQGNDPRPLHWIFVIQHNPEPNHNSFLISTQQFFTQPFPNVDRNNTAIFHVNTAASKSPLRKGSGAFSACVFSPRAPFDTKDPCRSTVCMQPIGLRGSDILSLCKDTVFREMGECIHLFQMRVPGGIVPVQGDRIYPITDAHVYPTHDTTDPRLRGGPVPPAVKWLNDHLDLSRKLSAVDLPRCALQPTSMEIEPVVIEKARTGNDSVAGNRVKWAACLPVVEKNVDKWATRESDALEFMVHSLTSLALAYELNVNDAALHGLLVTGADLIEVLAIRGHSYEDCRRHYEENIPKTFINPVLIIARDHSNHVPLPEEFTRFDEGAPASGLKFIDYQTLMQRCRVAPNIDVFREYIDGILPRNRTIL